MALTNDDLKNIEKVFDKKFRQLGVLTKNDLKKVEAKMATKVDLRELEAKMATKVELRKIEAKMATKNGLKKIEKKFDGLGDFLDRDYIKVKNDVRGIQHHLHLPVTDF